MHSSSEIAGRLAQIVVIERWQPARDAVGDDVGQWAVLGRARAEVRPDGALAPAAAGEAARSGRRWRVLLRDADHLGLDVRLRWGGRILTVRAVGRDPAVKGLATLICDAAAA